MAIHKESNEKSPRTPPPARTVEGRENQMIMLAVDLAEKQLRKGTASSQVIAHYLKLGSTSERLAKEVKQVEKDLLVAKAEALRSNKNSEELYTNALNAMRAYSGNEDEDE